MAEQPATRKRLVLVDGHANVFKAYHAIKTPLTTSSGETTHAVMGFLSMFLRLHKMVACDHVVVVFDADAPSFRHLEYEAYKATRSETPPDLHTQARRIRQVLAAMRVPINDAPGFEADDAIATLAVRAVEQGGEALVCSVDKDLLQIVRPGITVWRDHLGKIEELDPAGVKEKLGIAPELVPDYLGLIGDSSDNLPGIPGVGPKTAVKLLEEFGSFDALMEAASGLPEKKAKLRQSLLDHGAAARRSRDLARLRLDVPLEFSWESTRWSPVVTEELRSVLLELELGRLLRELEAAAPAPPPPAAPKPARRPLPADAQEDLFGSMMDDEREPLADAPPAAPVRDTDYRAIQSREALAETVAAIRAAGLCAIDTETTDLDPFAAELVGISLSWRPDQGVYIPVGHATGEAQLPLDEVRAELSPLFADGSVRWVAHHWKFDYKILKRAGFPVGAVASDTLVSAYLLQPDGGQRTGLGLKNLALERLGVAMTPISELIGDGKGMLTMAGTRIADASAYACADADLTLQLHHHFEPKLLDAGLAKLRDEVECPLTPVLADMELEGVRIDVPYFEAFGREAAADLQRIGEEVFALAGERFNINSPKQVGEVLFDKLGLKTAREKKTATGRSTDVSVLEELAKQHPLPAKLLEYRKLEKLRGTYIDALPKSVNPGTGRVHTSYNQTDVATGRISSSDPNLQNIPVRSEEGQRVRRGFVPRAAGWSLLAADYSQVELRILAHMSGDAALRRAFETGGDIHRLTASLVFKVPPEEITSAQRSGAKAINFGIVYGMTSFRLANDLGISRTEAQQFIDDYFAAYSGVRDFIERTKESARATGQVATMLGRRRSIPDMDSRNPNARAFAERIAVNTPIQGTSADMIKLAMIRLARRLAEERLDARMILQVHDELIFDVPDGELDKVKQLVPEEMARALPLSVPVKVDVECGANWAEV
ncbi:MAG: DNA polymerase I [Candidatus Sumerlaeia bacterium]|nr:DNA polymerase I [Candidatus Sumerlaeia bacterium]